MLGRAAERLTDLIGDQVIPLEDEISKVAAKQFPQFQHRFGPLDEKLAALGLPGADTVRSLTQELAEILLTDASDAPQRLGGAESSLYDDLRWATQVETAFKNGLESTIAELQRHRQQIDGLPNTGVPGQLRSDLTDDLSQLGERLTQSNFFQHAADFSTLLASIKTRTSNAALAMSDALKGSVKDGQHDLQQPAEWSELTQEEQSQSPPQLDALVVSAPEDLQGLKQLLNQEYEISSNLRDLKKSVKALGDQRRSEREREATRRRDEELAKAKKSGQIKLIKEVRLPAIVTSAAALNQVIEQLQALQTEAANYSEVEITLTL